LDEWLEKALRSNPELENLRARLNISQIELNKARAAHLPTLDLLLQLSQQDSDNVTNPNAKYRNRQIGVQFNMPLYSGGGISAQARQNLALLKEAELQIEALERRIINELTREFGVLSASKAKLSALNVSVAAAQQTLKAAERGVQAGTRSRLQVVEAHQRLSQTKFELGREQLVFWLALMRLEALAGLLDESSIVDLARHIHAQ
jgi:protease secretion system outer membrane protein